MPTIAEKRSIMEQDILEEIYKYIGKSDYMVERFYEDRDDPCFPRDAKFLIEKYFNKKFLVPNWYSKDHLAKDWSDDKWEDFKEFVTRKTCYADEVNEHMEELMENFEAECNA